MSVFEYVGVCAWEWGARLCVCGCVGVLGCHNVSRCVRERYSVDVRLCR